jgi:hypothetical protein
MDRNYTIGFVDMSVEVSVFDLGYTYPRYEVHNAQWDVERTSQWIHFEVKPSVTSAGEVIRQIRMYQSYLQGEYCIVSPDDRFASILEDQGIGFIKALSDEYDIIKSQGL